MSRNRVPSIDALRGLVMIVMALDHVRDFFHRAAMDFLPEDLSQTTTAIFLTRWITHFCAPVFMFTAGAGPYLWLFQGPNRTKPDLSRFLASRGLWLIVLELTVVRFAMFFSITSGVTVLEVIWALGCCMIILALLIYLPVRVLAVFSIVVIALHNLTDPISAGRAWDLLHRQDVFKVFGVPVVSAYPLMPWFAVMAAGYCFGEVMTFDETRRRAWMLRIGLALTAAFLVIRGIDIYGDPRPWSPGVHAVLSFLRVNKYPPSLDFLLMTLGPAILILAFFDRMRWSKRNPLIVFGRVPLFYFVGHLLLAHALTIPAALIAYGHAGFLLVNALPSMGGDASHFPPHFGYSLAVVYAVWILVVLLMYPACRRFANLKARRKDWWLSYL